MIGVRYFQRVVKASCVCMYVCCGDEGMEKWDT